MDDKRVQELITKQIEGWLVKLCGKGKVPRDRTWTPSTLAYEIRTEIIDKYYQLKPKSN